MMRDRIWRSVAGAAVAASLVAAGAVGATTIATYADSSAQQAQVRSVVAEQVAASFGPQAPVLTPVVSLAGAGHEDHAATPAPSATPPATNRTMTQATTRTMTTTVHHPTATPYATHHPVATPHATHHPTAAPHHAMTHSGHDGGHDGGHE
jgi:hypothetical protein